MQALRKLNQFFGFTPTEARVVYFLVITFVIGGAVKLYRSHYPLAFSPSFDYSELDKQFGLRARLIDSIEAVQEQQSSASGEAGKTKKRKATGVKKRSNPQSVIDINTATKEDLMKLPGIGEALAERILIHREENGKFKDVSELQKVKGIGGKKFEQIRPFVKVE